MARNTRRELALGVILGGLILAVWYRAWNADEPGGDDMSQSALQQLTERQTDTSVVASVPDVNLDVLTSDRFAPVTPGRDPFQFGANALRPVGVAAPPGGAAIAQPGRAVMPIPGMVPAPSLELKFIGTLDMSAEAGTVAVLSDSRFVYYGREGDIIDGRYRVVRIDASSIVLEYVDGRERQTIRLSGS